MSSQLAKALAFGAILTVTAACAVDSQVLEARKAISASLASDVASQVLARVDKDPKAFLDLLAKAKAEEAALPELFRRVDKAVALGPGFVPSDLVALDGTGLSVSRPGHRLRKPALEALLALDAAARRDGIVLVVGSAYRSYDYQVEVYARTVAQEGSEAKADRISARPGKSQHQLGMALDFSPIDESFAQTKASAWLTAHASAYGFSLSYPQGMEAVTGYTWESWHWRYVGPAAIALQKKYFGDVQQYLIQFWEAYTKK